MLRQPRIRFPGSLRPLSRVAARPRGHRANASTPAVAALHITAEWRAPSPAISEALAMAPIVAT